MNPFQNSISIILLICLAIILFLLWRRSVKLLKQVKFSQRSLSSKYGKMTEQFMPFIADYPYNSQDFRFIGSPIDGIQFNNNEIILVEFKSANSNLTARQKQIKLLAEKKLIKFEEHRIK